MRKQLAPVEPIDLSPAMKGFKQEGDENLLLYNICQRDRLKQTHEADRTEILRQEARRRMTRREEEDKQRRRTELLRQISYLMIAVMWLLCMVALMLQVQ